MKGLKAIVTGGASGIGEATAKLLNYSGAKVFVFDMYKPNNMIDGVEYVVCDISNTQQVNRSVSNVSKDGLDILINNAAIGLGGNVTTATEDDWKNVLNVNVIGIARMSSASIPFLRKSKNASIVNVSSTVSVKGFLEVAVYSASKGAVNALTLAMAADHLKDNIRVNAVIPATADTPWVERVLSNSQNPEEERKNLLNMQPMKRLVTAEEVAYAILYLCSPSSSSTTATILNVDGGVTGLRI